MAQEHGHLTTEQLSALLDGELSAEEQAWAEEHLKQCGPCSLQLADLRQTVAMLHALPQPKLPRSFTLSPEALAMPAQTRPQPIPLATARRRAWPSPVLTTIRTISTLAAMVGIVILLSGLLSFSHGGMATSGTASSNAPSSGGAVSQNAQPAAPHMTATAQSQSTQQSYGATTSANATAQAQQRATAIAHEQQQVTATAQAQQEQATATATRAQSPPMNRPEQEPSAPAPWFDLGQPGGRALLGLCLLVLSVVGFVVLRLQRKRLNGAVTK